MSAPATYRGLSTDTKPTTGVVVDAVFIESDTDTKSEWDGDSWVKLSVAGAKYAILADSSGIPLGTEHGAVSVSTAEHLMSFSQEYTATTGGNVAATSILTPATGRSLAVYAVSLHTSGSSGDIAVDFATSSIKVARLYPSKNSQDSDVGMHMVGAANEVLTFQASGIGNSAKVFIMLNYVEHTT